MQCANNRTNVIKSGNVWRAGLFDHDEYHGDQCNLYHYKSYRYQQLYGDVSLVHELFTNTALNYRLFETVECSISSIICLSAAAIEQQSSCFTLLPCCCTMLLKDDISAGATSNIRRSISNNWYYRAAGPRKLIIRWPFLQLLPICRIMFSGDDSEVVTCQHQHTILLSLLSFWSM